jgi:hypothetical protein
MVAKISGGLQLWINEWNVGGRLCCVVEVKSHIVRPSWDTQIMVGCLTLPSHDGWAKGVILSGMGGGGTTLHWPRWSVALYVEDVQAWIEESVRREISACTALGRSQKQSYAL